MADVTTAFTLPADAATGTVERISLGGNGFTAPSGQYLIRNVAAVGDGTGIGLQSVQIGMDDTWTWMLGYASFSVSQGTPTDIDWRMQLVGARVPTQFTNGHLDRSRAFTLLTPEIAETWLPPASINAGNATLSAFVPNVGTDTLLFSATIFLFDIRARETYRYGGLVDARGGV